MHPLLVFWAGTLPTPDTPSEGEAPPTPGYSYSVGAQATAKRYRYNSAGTFT